MVLGGLHHGERSVFAAILHTKNVAADRVIAVKLEQDVAWAWMMDISKPKAHPCALLALHSS